MSVVRINDRQPVAVEPVAAPAPIRKRRRARKPRAPRWPAPAALRPIEWGQPDPVLAAMVCRSLDRAMPATPWEWSAPRTAWLHSRAGTFLGWAAVIVLILGTLAGMRPA